jgi:hypothetical protein
MTLTKEERIKAKHSYWFCLIKEPTYEQCLAINKAQRDELQDGIVTLPEPFVVNHFQTHFSF